MVKFPKVLGFLNLKAGSDPVTEANLQAAEDKISQLEQDKTAADLKAEQAAADLKIATEAKAKADTALAAEQEKTATLEAWKKQQASIDGREEDESNNLDNPKEALAPWEQVAASTIATTKKRLGEK